jgi:hypothetical protein
MPRIEVTGNICCRRPRPIRAAELIMMMNILHHSCTDKSNMQQQKYF